MCDNDTRVRHKQTQAKDTSPIDVGKEIILDFHTVGVEEKERISNWRDKLSCPLGSHLPVRFQVKIPLGSSETCFLPFSRDLVTS